MESYFKDESIRLKSHNSKEILSDAYFDVKVIGYTLENYPAKLTTKVEIAGEIIYSNIIYHSIPNWEDVWGRLDFKEQISGILGVIVAWDCMRFMALGGERLYLCAGLAMDTYMQSVWKYCFLNQFGEWRYRNNFKYTSTDFPKILSEKFVKKVPFSLEPEANKETKWLLTNGGGKDTLAGIALLKDAGMNFDVYEGVLPIGGDCEVQDNLLRDLRHATKIEDNKVIKVSISDNFYTISNEKLKEMGVLTSHIKCDFAVGHTANYPGYFPLIIFHQYSNIFFNIEKSADRVMLNWHGEDINHQWCKSGEYQAISTNLFTHITNSKSFLGFKSTLRGINDTLIYKIAASHDNSLLKTHSCNIAKPWCCKCPKCCFSYLMMTSIKDELYAKKVMGISYSLFNDNENESNWRSLLDSNYVAWECVPAHEECIYAISLCLNKGLNYPILKKYASNLQLEKFEKKYHRVEWLKIPNELRLPLLNRIKKADTFVTCDVVVIGGGQNGLSMSYYLKEKNIDHVVLELGEIGNSWNKRWDSFKLNTPNKVLNLPGMGYQGNDPHGFSMRDQVKNTLKNYAERFDLPVIEKIKVERVVKVNGHFNIFTSAGRIVSKALVVASGEYAKPKFPSVVNDLPAEIKIMHSSEYKNFNQIKAFGNILVVGGGQSGAQIVDELNSLGARVFWSISNRPSNIRRIYNKDFMEWWEIGGILHRHVNEIPDVKEGKPGALHKARTTEFPLVSGIGNNGLGKSISLMDFHERGVILVGKLDQAVGKNITFNDIESQLEQSIKGTQNEFDFLSTVAKDFYKDNLPALDTNYVPREIRYPFEISPIEKLDLKNENIGVIIFATGYKNDWSFLEINNIFDDFDYPIGNDGISPCEGLYFMGLFNIQRLSSTCLCNEGKDASILIEHIHNRISNCNF